MIRSARATIRPASRISAICSGVLSSITNPAPQSPQRTLRPDSALRRPGSGSPPLVIIEDRRGGLVAHSESVADGLRVVVDPGGQLPLALIAEARRRGRPVRPMKDLAAVGTNQSAAQAIDHDFVIDLDTITASRARLSVSSSLSSATACSRVRGNPSRIKPDSTTSGSESRVCIIPMVTSSGTSSPESRYFWLADPRACRLESPRERCCRRKAARRRKLAEAWPLGFLFLPLAGRSGSVARPPTSRTASSTGWPPSASSFREPRSR